MTIVLSEELCLIVYYSRLLCWRQMNSASCCVDMTAPHTMNTTTESLSICDDDNNEGENENMLESTSSKSDYYRVVVISTIGKWSLARDWGQNFSATIGWLNSPDKHLCSSYWHLTNSSELHTKMSLRQDLSFLADLFMFREPPWSLNRYSGMNQLHSRCDLFPCSVRVTAIEYFI